MATKAQKIAASVAERAERARKVLCAYAETQYPADETMQDYWPVDLMTDLRHLCDAQGYDWSEVVRMSFVHYRAECAGEDIA